MDAVSTLLVVSAAVSVALAGSFAGLYLRRGFWDTSGGGVDDANKANAMLIRQYGQVRDEIAEVKREVAILRQWSVMLQTQIIKLGGTPVTEHDAAVAIGLAVGPHVAHASGPHTLKDTLAKLRDVLANRFTDEELLAVAVDAGFTRDAVAGESQMARAIRLVEYAAQRDAVDALKRAIEKYRPGALA